MTDAEIRAFIEQKRRGEQHSSESLRAFIEGFVRGEIGEAPVAAWMMAVCWRGMTTDETVQLTSAMADSGEKLDWSDVPGPVVDKHSTGGVGDAASLVAVPLAAACGVKVAKLSGRALGHTGGTIDKLECVPGLRTDIDIADLKRQVAEVGCAIAEANDRLAPADKKIYALRDRTATIESVPLIAASVLSKKIAGGAPAIVLDVKCGRGAFIQSIHEARRLAKELVGTGARLGRRLRVVLSSMDEPLAPSIGDALELDDALTLLERPAMSGPASRASLRRLAELSIALARAMLETAGLSGVDPAAKLEGGAAKMQFEAMLRAQGGRPNAFDRRFEPRGTATSPKDGFITAVDARALGEIVADAKAHHPKEVAQRTGIRLLVRSGDRIERGRPLLHWFGPEGAMDEGQLAAAFSIGDAAPTIRPLILGEVESA